MSKHYLGIKFHSNSFVELHKLISEWRKQLIPLTIKTRSQELANSFCEKFDFLVLTDTKIIVNVLRDVQTKFNEDVSKDTISYEFSVILLPFENNIYGMIFTERTEWREAFSKLVLYDEYEYWDHADRPANLTAEEWAERLRIWDSIFADTYIPKSTGFEASCTVPSYQSMPTKNDIFSEIKPVKERAHSLARDMIGLYARIDRLTKEPELLSTTDYGGSSSLYFEVLQFIASDEGKEKIAQKTKELEEKLFDITIEML